MLIHQLSKDVIGLRAVFNNGFKIQFCLVDNGTSWVGWTFPTAFSNVVCGFQYTSGAKNGAWDHANYMHHNCCDYLSLTGVNIFAHNLGKGVARVAGFVIVYGF